MIIMKYLTESPYTIRLGMYGSNLSNAPLRPTQICKSNGPLTNGSSWSIQFCSPTKLNISIVLWPFLFKKKNRKGKTKKQSSLPTKKEMKVNQKKKRWREIISWWLESKLQDSGLAKKISESRNLKVFSRYVIRKLFLYYL